MEEKQYKVDHMLECLIDLASEEVEKAKQRGYFNKDFAEGCGIVISLANEKYSGTGAYHGGYGTYGNGRNDYPGYGGYGNTRDGYGNSREGYGGYEHDEYEGTGAYNTSRRTRR